MSARSSSGSWSGGGGAAPDIIDLDKFMRGAVRPSRRIDNEARNLRDQLVVDAGGVERKVPALGAAAGAGAAAAPPGAAVSARGSTSSSSTRHHKRHAKRFSHDSGLSDGSYAQRKHRPHRRAAESSRVSGDGARAGAGSTASLRAFRAVCERTLLDQQAQIARVAQLCERLTERQQPPPAPPPRRSDTTSPRTSDVTSTSRSTRTRKDKHRTEECKTYKIIMNKLDELNRRFGARGVSPGARPPAPPRRREPSSGSVSMSDKLVSTEPALLQTSGGGARRSPTGAGAGARRGAGVRAVTNTCMLDIAPQPPQPPQPRRNVTTESVIECDSGPKVTSACDARCGFDLEDPMHLYTQAKRLQALPATTRRARSVGSALESRCSEHLGAHAGDRAGAHAGAHAGCHEPRDTSICALCRGYWRSLRQYLATQLFCTPQPASR